MSTRSRIAITTNNGKRSTYRSIYCHFDGYPDGVGRTLAKHYTTRQKIEKLMKRGDLSPLGREVGKNRHKWQIAQKEASIAYRDRGEKNTHAKKATGLDRLIAQAQQCFAEYLYVWTDNYGWNCIEVPYKD